MGLGGLAVDERQPEPQPEEGHATVVGLAAPLRGLGRDAAHPVAEDHRGLHLVAVLAAGAAPLRARLVAIAEEIVGGEACRVHRSGVTR